MNPFIIGHPWKRDPKLGVALSLNKYQTSTPTPFLQLPSQTCLMGRNRKAKGSGVLKVSPPLFQIDQSSMLNSSDTVLGTFPAGTI